MPLYKYDWTNRTAIEETMKEELFRVWPTLEKMAEDEVRYPLFPPEVEKLLKLTFSR